jgi:tetratricopeptide (TPR) repeat protein
MKNLNIRLMTLAAILAAMLFLSGCGTSLMYLNSAQNTYNNCAENKDQLRILPAIEDSIIPPSSISCYEKAYASLEKALKNKDALQKENALASAYSLKALCEWKLNKYDEAKTSADAALGEILGMEPRGASMPRDKALMQALPFLMEVEKMKTGLYAFHSPESPVYQDALDFHVKNIFNPTPDKKASLEDAIHNITRLREPLPEALDELKIYLISSQLAGMKTWSDALDFLRKSAVEGSEEERQKAKDYRYSEREKFLDPLKKEFLDELKKLLPEGENDPRYKYWMGRF